MIGTANYDVGHFFNTGGGGLAGAGPCLDTSKAIGCTGSELPQGDPFVIDFVAHEIGHQFGADHTWVGVGDSCEAGSFAANSAYEPGGGSTILAYAGICGDQDLQMNSDDNFHRHSIDQIFEYIDFDGTCSVNTPDVNPNEPTADAGADYTIPISTPFELTGSGSDADNDTLTYNWEQFDLGQHKPLATGDDGVQPIFRAWPSSGSSTRVFPRLQDLVAGTLAKGETLPVTDRTMNFQLTVRDNRPGGGRENNDGMTVTSVTSAGPFQVTSPDGGESRTGNGTVTWDVANTAAAPVSAASVDIRLSTDGGLTYPTVLATATANDGSAEVTFPSVNSSTARVKIQGSDNIFFDISDANFTISAGSTNTLTVMKGGTGTGTVTSVPAGIDCGADCSEQYTPGTQVDLTAAVGAGSTFAGWSGGSCSGTGNCVVTLNANTTVTATFNTDGASCGGAICLNANRFQVDVDWRTAQGDTGQAVAVPGVRSDDSGVLYFFSANNWEMLIKVLDGCAITDHFWVFAAATTDVEYTLSVTDTQTMESTTYFNPLGTAAAAITDTSALAVCNEMVTSAPENVVRPVTATRTWVDELAKQATCVPSATNLCLNQNRFQVEVDWETEDGGSGSGQVVPFAVDDSASSTSSAPTTGRCWSRCSTAAPSTITTGCSPPPPPTWATRSR